MGSNPVASTIAEILENQGSPFFCDDKGQEEQRNLPPVLYLAFIAVILANELWLSAFPCSFDSDTARLIKKKYPPVGSNFEICPNN